MSRRQGFSLIEMLVVVVVISLAGLIAFPKFSQALASSNLRNAKAKVTTLYAGARAAAAGSGRTAYVHFTENRIYVTATPRRNAPIGANTIDTLTPLENVYTQYGVGISASSDSIRIDPAGLGRDSAVIVLATGSQTATIRISQFGRIVK